MYPVENHIPGILYTYKKSFGFLIFRLTAAYKKKMTLFRLLIPQERRSTPNRAVRRKVAPDLL
jgi:hypothetical protein